MKTMMGSGLHFRDRLELKRGNKMTIDIYWNDLTDKAKSRIIETVGEDYFDDYTIIGILHVLKKKKITAKDSCSDE